MDFIYNKGERVIIELKSSEIIEGDFEASSKNHIDLINVFEYDSRAEPRGLLTYYRNEITAIHIFRDNKNSKQRDDQMTMLNKANGSKPKIITFNIVDYKFFQDTLNNFIYMATIDSRYISAVKYLGTCENVALAGMCGEKTNVLSLLVLSSWDQVYIFDIMLFAKKDFPVELKIILESKTIRKVLHDSRFLVKCLSDRGIKLNNIFDTQVADTMISHKNNISTHDRTLSECLCHYFNFPRIVEDISKLDSRLWNIRPMDASSKLIAAGLVIYLITLKNKLEEIMLQPYRHAVNIFTHSWRNLSRREQELKKPFDIPQEIIALELNNSLVNK